MRGIFFEENSERLGETQEGGASRTGKDGSCGRDGSGGSGGRDGVQAARAERGCGGGSGRWSAVGETRRDFETLGETRSEGGDGGLKVGKERVVHFFGVGLIY